MRLIVEHLWTRIEGKYPDNVVEKATSYFQDGYFFSPQYKKGYWDGRVKLFDKKGLRFPTGLLSRVTAALDLIQWDYEVEDDRDFPEIEPVYELNGASCRPYQREAVDAGLSSPVGTLRMGTGAGKSVVGAALIKSLNRETIWITHRTALARQMRERLSKLLNQPVGLVGDGVEEIEKVTICTVQTLDRSEAEHRQELRDFLSRVEVLIADEIHHVSSAGSDQWYRQIMKTNAQWRYGLTATPDFEGAGMRLTAITGGVIYEISAKQLIDLGFLVPPRIWWIEIDEKVTGDKWASVYRDGVTESDTWNGAAASAANRLSLDGKPPLILVRHIKHGKAIVDKCRGLGMEVDFIHGGVPLETRDLMLTALETKQLHAIVAQVETMGEGMDYPWLLAIIDAIGEKGGGNAAKGETGYVTIQGMGRGLRPYKDKKHLDYVSFLHTGNKHLKKASKDRFGTLESEGYGEYMGFWRDYTP